MDQTAIHPDDMFLARRARELLLESAAPFDEACTLITQLLTNHSKRMTEAAVSKDRAAPNGTPYQISSYRALCSTLAKIPMDRYDVMNVTLPAIYIRGAISLIESQAAGLDMLRQMLEKSQKFKEFVHKFLDDHAVPTNPEPEVTANNGCRIGCRLKWVYESMSKDRETVRSLLQRLRPHVTDDWFPPTLVAEFSAFLLELSEFNHG